MVASTRLVTFLCCFAPLELAAQHRADLEGVVRDRSAMPVQGAQVWALSTPFGAITDSRGRFRILQLRNIGFALAVRICGRSVEGKWPMMFDPRDPKPVELVVDSIPSKCAPLGRPAWTVDSTDPMIEGYYIASWEGMPFVSCANEFSYAWLPDSALGVIGAFGLDEGERMYVRARARQDDDPARPGSMSMFVGEVFELRRPRSSDCRPALLKQLPTYDSLQWP
jgi:hypothetical protein